MRLYVWIFRRTRYSVPSRDLADRRIRSSTDHIRVIKRLVTPRNRRVNCIARALASVVLISGASVSFAQTGERPPLPTPTADADTGVFTIPAPTGFVNDFAHVLTPATIAALDSLVREVRVKCHGEITVVTLPSLHGQQIRDVATRIGNTWGVGYSGAPTDPATNTGVVILLAPNDRRAWIGTSDGARVFIPDSVAAATAALMTPYFAKGEYNAGLRNGARMIAQQFANRFHFTLTVAEATAEGVECVQLYSQARTESDSAVIDARLPFVASAKQPHSLTCGLLRRSGQLQRSSTGVVRNPVR